MSDPAVIGRVEFDLDGQRAASLYSDGSWAVEPEMPDRRQALFLAILRGYTREYRGPEDGFFGPAQLAKCAEYFDGTITLQPEIPDDDPDLVY